MKTASRVGVTLAAFLSASAAADEFKNEYVNDNEFELEIRHMPDLDQNRAGLGNDGQCHCVPTSTMNTLIYIANHGFPQVDPGPGFWDNPALYDLATAYIETLSSAAFMNTSFGEPPEDNTCGSSSDGGYDGLKKWVEPHGIFVIGDQASGFVYTPNFTFIAKNMMNGALGTVTYGKYEVQGDIKGVPVVKRTGGHVMTAVRFKADVNGRTLWVRDPDDDNPVDLNTQTPFNTSRMFDVTTMQVIVVDNEDNPIGMKTMDHLFTTFDKGVFAHRLIDGHRWIRLKNGYTLTNDGHSILTLPPGGENPASIPSPSGNPILGLAPDINGHEFYVVSAGPAGGPNTLHRVGTVDGAVTPADTIADPSLVTTSGNYIYVKCGGNDLCCVPGPEYPRGLFSTTPPFPFEIMAHDDEAGEILLVSTTAFKLMRYADIATTPTVLDIPTTVLLGANPRMAVNPTDGKVWVSSDASSTLYGLSENTGGPMLVEFLNHPLVVNPVGLDFDDRGHMFVATGGAIVELEEIAGGGWQPVPMPVYGTASAFGLLHVDRSRTNATALHDDPAWMNIPHGERLVIGDAVLDCYADLDGDGFVGIFEFLFVLGAWGPCDDDCPADLDHDGEVGINEFLTVLAAWGPCP